MEASLADTVRQDADVAVTVDLRPAGRTVVRQHPGAADRLHRDQRVRPDGRRHR